MIILSFFHFSIEFHEIYLTSGIISVFPTVKFSNLEKFNFLNSSILWNVINHYHSFRIDSKTKFNAFLTTIPDRLTDRPNFLLANSINSHETWC